jgi:GT2 family glycosyltransferase
MHEVLVFIDSDNQDTYSMLVNMKRDMSNLRICRNPNQYPVGGQRNVTVMFNEATNDIVCYLQSDMVVGKDFDLHIAKNLKKDVVLSCARIEPPLHPPSSEKIVKDFGITPETFDWDSFHAFVEHLQAENRPNIEGHFAPFAVHKDAWINQLGGFDTQFRCSREDSDSMIRMDLCGLKKIQSWNACVYHFTCVSSRGDDWFKESPEAAYKNKIQHQADMQELKRFIRKWGFFGHNARPVYDISFDVELDHFADINLLKAIEPYCTRMYLSDPNVAAQLASQLEFEAYYYSNLRWNYPYAFWKEREYLFNPTDFNKRIQYANERDGDVIVYMKHSDLTNQWNPQTQQIIENIHQIVDQYEEGTYDAGFGKIVILQKRNLAPSMVKHKDVDVVLNSEVFKFE